MDIKTLKKKVKSAKQSLKDAQAKYITAVEGDANDAEIRKLDGLVKSAETRLETAKNRLREARMSHQPKFIRSVFENKTVRKVVGYTAIAVTLAATATGGYLAYDRFKNGSEDSTDTV